MSLPYFTASVILTDCRLGHPPFPSSLTDHIRHYHSPHSTVHHVPSCIHIVCVVLWHRLPSLSETEVWEYLQLLSNCLYCLLFKRFSFKLFRFSVQVLSLKHRLTLVVDVHCRPQIEVLVHLTEDSFLRTRRRIRGEHWIILLEILLLSTLNNAFSNRVHVKRSRKLLFYGTSLYIAACSKSNLDLFRIWVVDVVVNKKRVSIQFLLYTFCQLGRKLRFIY